MLFSPSGSTASEKWSSLSVLWALMSLWIGYAGSSIVPITSICHFHRRSSECALEKLFIKTPIHSKHVVHGVGLAGSIAVPFHTLPLRGRKRELMSPANTALQALDTRHTSVPREGTEA